MDAEHFDRLARTLAAPGTRRRLLSLLTALPLGVTLTTLVGEAPDATAKDDDHGSSHRRRRRKAKHRHKSGKDKENRKGKRGKKCRPESAAQTCAGRCGKVVNRCGKAVECGSCACGGCQICQFCDADTGQCVPNGSVVGQVCGTRQVCQANGSCACDATTCTGAGPGMSCGGGATAGVCGCTPQTVAAACGSQSCGATQDNCGQTVTCTGCTGCCDDDQCLDGGSSPSCGVAGATCRACTPFESCGATGCEALPACGGATNGPCRVFVTSTFYRGGFGSVAVGDQICQERAAEAGLPGIYQAWLSSDTEGPAFRFLNQSPGPYWRIDGTPIADNWGDLIDQSLAAPINIDETGDPVVGLDRVWTGTRPNGTPAFSGDVSLSCQNWTSSSDQQEGMMGSRASTNAAWTNSLSRECGSEGRLYCFQQSA